MKKKEKKKKSYFTGSYFTSRTVTSSKLITLLVFPPPPCSLNCFCFPLASLAQRCSCTHTPLPTSEAGAGADSPPAPGPQLSGDSRPPSSCLRPALAAGSQHQHRCLCQALRGRGVPGARDSGRAVRVSGAVPGLRAACQPLVLHGSGYMTGRGPCLGQGG